MASYMNHKIHIQGNLATVRLSRKASVEGFSDTAKAIIASPGWMPGFNILSDYSELDLSQLAGDDMERFAKALSPYRKSLGNGLCACVSTKPLDFGLGRMWEVFMEQHSDLRVCIFYDLEKAQKWLLSENKNE